MSFQGQTGNVWKGCEMKTFINLMKDQSGASAAEYALILAIVGGAIAIAAVALGGSISGAMKKAGNCINAGSTATSTICP
jgi:pilus assembly protein Flp/PilA